MLKVPARHIIVLMLLCTVAVVFAAAKSHVPPQKHSGHPARQAQEAPRPPRYSLDDLYPSTNVPVDIPDGPGGVALSTITVPEDITITDINVMVSITHNWIRDLRISLIPPASDTLEVILLELLPQDSAINMVDTWFNDEAVTLIDDGVPPFTGVFRPQNPLSALDDLNANGTWTLRVEDMFRVDSGRVEAWAIFVNPDISLAGTITDEDTDDPIGGVSVVVLGGAAQTISDNAGEYAIEGIAPGTYSVQFTNENYDTLTYPDVVIAAGSPYELDVALHPRFLLREFSTRPTDSVAIPAQGEATLTYTLSETLLVYDVDITVNIAHTFPSDLSLFLTGPGNQIL